MRKQTTIKIDDAGHNLTFHITQLSARSLEIFLFKAAKIFAKAGLLDADFDSVKDATDITASIAKLLLDNGTQVISKFDVDAGAELMDDLLEKCVERVDGGLARIMSPSEIEASFESLPALFQLQKETLKLNLNFLSSVAQSNTQASHAKPTNTQDQKISLRSYKS